MATFGNKNVHGKVSVIIQPANAAGQLQTSIDLAASQNSKSLFSNLANNDDDNLSDETIAALENKYVSKAFEDLYKRGINPLRAEILLVNELIPIGTGENHEDNPSTASINLNYGAGTNLKVNQVMRLIDLQRIIRKNILKLSGDFLEEFIGLHNGTQKRLITGMQTILKENSDQFVVLGSDTELMITLLLDLGANNETGSGVFGVLFRNFIKSASGSRLMFVRSIARYVILDYVAQNTISFITKIYNLKNSLSEAISISDTSIPPSTTDNESQFAYESGFIINSLSGINSARKLLRLFGMPEYTSDYGPVEPPGTSQQQQASGQGYSWGKEYMLSDVIDSNINTGDGFGSNRHMYTHLFANLLKNMSFIQTLDGNQQKDITESKVSFTKGTKNLANGLNILKGFTASSMTSGASELRGPSTSARLDGSRIEEMLDSVSNSRDSALTQLVTAVCYDQVVSSNINGGKTKFINPLLGLPLTTTTDSDNSPFIAYFNTVFFNTGVTSWSALSDQNLVDFNYSSFAANSERLGTYLKERFEPKSDDGLVYISSEHSYKDNVHRLDDFVSGPDYYFNKAVASENINFSGMLNDANKILSDVDELVYDIAAMFGLDFDTNGDPVVSNINAYTLDNSPLGYFYRMCDKLGSEARKTAADTQNSADLSVPLMHAGSFDDMTFTADTIKASYFGAYRLNENTLNADNRTFYRRDPTGPAGGVPTTNLEEDGKLATLVVKAEHVYLVEQQVWLKLFKTKLSKILKEGDPSNLITSELEYLANKQINTKDGNVIVYKSIIHNGANKNGIGDFNSSENGIKVRFGTSGAISGHRADYVVEAITRNKVDNKLDDKLNIKKTEKHSSYHTSGVGFSKDGAFEEFLLSNEALYPKSVSSSWVAKRENSHFPHVNDLSPADLKVPFKAEENVNYMIRSIPENVSGTWPSGKRVDWNDKAGEYGGIFKTSTSSRYTLFTLFFARMYYKSLGMIYEGQEKELHIHYFPSHWAGMADALERKGKDPAYSSNGKYSEGKRNYDHAYQSARSMIRSVVNAMEERRKSILKNLEYLKQNSREIKAAVTAAKRIVNGSSGELSQGEKISLAYLKKIGFMKTGLTFLNENTAGILLKNYQKNYLLDFHSNDTPSSAGDVEETKEGVSTYPYFKLEGYDIRELKIMAKLFSENGRALTSNIDDKIGRKNIMHIGIPNGTLRYLQNIAYQKTGELAYYNSSNIVIHITKKNSLDPQIKYQSRSYVFNMSKHIASLKTSTEYTTIQKSGQFSVGNHLKNYNDDWTISDIKSNVEILTTSKTQPIYASGLDGIKIHDGVSSFYETEYDDYVYEEMLENHLYDHYAKLYTNATTGIDMSETMFPLDSNKVFDGKLDPGAAEAYSLLADELIKRYPAANIIPSVSQEFYRMLKTIRSSLYFSSEARFESFVSTQCFDRVFSIPVSERDFGLKLSSYNMAASDVYKDENMPKLTLTSKKMISSNSIANVTGEDEETINNQSNLYNHSPAKLVLEYGKGLNNNKVAVSTFVVEIAILKSSK